MQLLEAYVFFLEPGLQLIELFEVRPSSPYRGRHGSLSLRMTFRSHIGRGSCI
jgi:hypothetical protein